MTVSAILKSKGRKVATARPDTTVETVAHRLRLESIGALVVTEDGHRVLGVISERDIVWGLAEHGAALLAKRADEVMARIVPTCTPETRVERVMVQMTRERARHVPVIEENRLFGIVSIGDVVKHRLDEMEGEVRVLRDYIAAR
ncbi:MAG: CBS domain-containing protein [Alphaproteobacteria bacterium]